MNQEQKQESCSQVNRNKTCLFACIDSICGGDADVYFPAYIGFFPFCYGEDAGSDIGNRIQYAENAMFNKLMRRYSGYDVYFEKHDCHTGLQKLREACRAGKPVILGIDAYYCSFSSAYEKTHILHNIIVVACDDAAAQLVCMDPFGNGDSRLWLPLEAYYKGYENIRILEPCENKMAFSKQDMIMLLLRNYNAEENADAFKRFYTEVGAAQNMEALFDSMDVRNCALIRKCREAATGRYGIALLFCKYAGQAERQIEDYFYESAKIWLCMAMLCMKLLLTGRGLESVKTRLQECILRLGELEKDIGKLLIEMAAGRKGEETGVLDSERKYCV